MRNPLRGLFRPTAEDNAALDVVRVAMEDVRDFGARWKPGPNGGWHFSGDSAFHNRDFDGECFPRDIGILDARGYPVCMGTPVLELFNIEIPLSRSARRELRRMVSAFRVRLAMEAVRVKEEAV